MSSFLECDLFGLILIRFDQNSPKNVLKRNDIGFINI